MKLRPYQEDIYFRVREEFRKHDSVCMQLQTGAGKTIIFSRMTSSAHALGNRIWIMVPRNELLQQASDQLSEINVTHGIIDAKNKESKAFRVHVVSKDTLIRRYDKIKIPPDFLIVDEAHLALERYREIFCKLWYMNPQLKTLGVTATPERLDGRGLSEIYDTLIEGPSLKELIELGFISEFQYFCPPIQGLDKVKRRGTEYVQDELEQLLLKRRIYGDAIKHYREYADGKPALVYCRSIKSASETAERFSQAGYRFENIDGTMSYKRRKALIDGLKDGRLHGLTSCELICYGLDVPRVEAIIMLRPTLSRTLYCQMIGRGLRPYMDPDSGYRKKKCVVLDHVSNLMEHGHPLQDYNWQFNGREKRKKRKDSNNDVTVRLCPEIGFMYCDRPTCNNCPYGGTGLQIGRVRAELEKVDGNLVEAKAPVRLNSRPFQEKREYIDRINSAIMEYKTAETFNQPITGPISDLLAIADSLGRHPLWVYWRLSKDMYTVNVPLLHEIARQKGYKPGWVWFSRKKIAEKLNQMNNSRERRDHV